MNNMFEDNITALLTKHDNDQITLDQLKEIAKQMFDDTQYGETKNARVMLFSMMYAPHLKPGDSTKIGQAYQTGSTFGAEINKGVNLGMELRKLGSVGAHTNSTELPHTNYCNQFVLDVFKYFESTGELELLVQNAEVKDAPFYNDGSKTVILRSDTLTCSRMLLIATEEQIQKRNAKQKLWYADSKLSFGDETVYVATSISDKMISQLGAFVKEFFDGKYSIAWNKEAKEYQMKIVANEGSTVQPLFSNSSNNQFFYDVMRHVEGIDKFHAWEQFLGRHSCKNDGAHTINLKDGEHKITYLFLGGDDEIIKGEVRQKEFEAGRWFKESFDVNGERAFLSVSTPADCIEALDHFVRKSYNLRIIKNEDVWELWRAEECPALDFGDNEPWQKIFFGTPGGGKSYKVKQIIEEEGATKRCFRTTFHPDTDYASFVGSYKPVMDGKEITYQFIPQIFTNAYVAAWNDPKNDYYLVIEEINRGNCAQIFGDLFQLLDRNNENGFSEYGIVADADLRKYLETAVNGDGTPVLINKQGIHKGELLLPPNLSILATMNTSDQSLFPMDSAFKRRWAWEFVPSTYKEDDNYELTFGDKTYKWHDFLDAVNPRIKEATDSEDKQLGAYFIKSDMDAEEFKSKVMYYLWSEICKEEYKTRNNFFRHKVGDKPDVEFTFNELYTNGPEDATLLNEFMEYILKKD